MGNHGGVGPGLLLCVSNPGASGRGAAGYLSNDGCRGIQKGGRARLAQLAIQVAPKPGLICESWCKSGSSKVILPGGKLVYGSLAQNPRGENSSPEDYWTVGAIRGHSFYKVLSSKSPVASTLNLNDVKCLQDLALAQDMTRGVILDSIFRQVDRLGNISVDQLQHYVTNKGKVKWDDKRERQ